MVIYASSSFRFGRDISPLYTRMGMNNIDAIKNLSAVRLTESIVFATSAAAGNDVAINADQETIIRCDCIVLDRCMYGFR